MYTVLIDDDATALFLTERLLLHEGVCDVAAFSSPPDALAYLRQQIPAGRVPQVVLLDLNMPLINGWDFLEMLQRHEAELHSQCIVYLLTSSLAPADKARADAHPWVTGLVHKPLDKLQIQLIQEHARSVTPARDA